jgi:hypothetical protein
MSWAVVFRFVEAVARKLVAEAESTNLAAAAAATVKTRPLELVSEPWVALTVVEPLL